MQELKSKIQGMESEILELESKIQRMEFGFQRVESRIQEESIIQEIEYRIQGEEFSRGSGVHSFTFKYIYHSIFLGIPGTHTRFQAWSLVDFEKVSYT